MTPPRELVGGTVWQKTLFRHLTCHAEREADALASYQHAATDSHSGAFRYLASLILEEEERHHRPFADLAATLAVEVDQGHEGYPIPRLGHWGFERSEVVTVTEQLLAQERGDVLELAKLAEDLESVKDETMWQLLVGLMQADTTKHIQILEFVRRHAREGAVRVGCEA